MRQQELTEMIASLGGGIILTPPKYLEQGSWRVEIYEKEKPTPEEAFHFLARPFLEPEQTQFPAPKPKHYIVEQRAFYNSILKRVSVISIIDVTEPTEVHIAETTAKERVEKLARAEIPKLKDARHVPYLGEVLVKSKNDYDFKKTDLSQKNPNK